MCGNNYKNYNKKKERATSTSLMSAPAMSTDMS